MTEKNKDCPVLHIDYEDYKDMMSREWLPIKYVKPVIDFDSPAYKPHKWLPIQYVKTIIVFNEN